MLRRPRLYQSCSAIEDKEEDEDDDDDDDDDDDAVERSRGSVGTIPTRLRAGRSGVRMLVGA